MSRARSAVRKQSVLLRSCRCFTGLIIRELSPRDVIRSCTLAACLPSRRSMTSSRTGVSQLSKVQSRAPERRVRAEVKERRCHEEISPRTIDCKPDQSRIELFSPYYLHLTTLHAQCQWVGKYPTRKETDADNFQTNKLMDPWCVPVQCVAHK